MPENPLTPEENLLRIIEGPSDAARAMQRARPRSPVDPKLAWKLFQAKYLTGFAKYLNFKAMNIALLGLGGCVTFFLVADFIAGLPRADALARLEEAAKTASIGDISIERIPPLEVFLQEITQRNVFALVPSPAPVEPQVAAQAALAAQTSQILQDAVKSLRVVGILWSETPQAILEEVADGRTHLVNRGNTIKQVRVKDILKDRVILSYDNKDVEIR
jgi:hypothetical protein